MTIVQIYNDAGDVVMSVESFSREGSTLVIEGRLMGAWKSKMYFPASELPGMLKLMVTNSSILMFVLMFPFALLKGRKNKK